MGFRPCFIVLTAHLHTDTDGLYLQDCQLGSPDPHAIKMDNAERLWTLSEELVKEKFSL
jgi:hypothetical protein